MATAPTISQQPTGVVLCPSSSALFSVFAASTPPFTFLWQWQPTPGTAWVNIVDGPNTDPLGGPHRFTAAGARAGTVTIGNVGGSSTASSHWEKRCIVSNICGSVTSDTATLTILSGSDPACGGPGCDPDVNQDGNADQGDIDYLINVVAGGENTTNIDPDFNRDGNSDQGDIDTLINVIAGGICP